MTTQLKRTLPHVAGLLALTLAGCAMDTAQPERAGTPRARAASDFATRRIEHAGLADVQPVAARVFRSYFRVDSTLSSPTDLLAFPTDVKPHEAAGRPEEPAAEEGPGEPPPKDTVGDVVGVAPRRYRRIAELRLVAADGATLAQVRVMFQRLTTTERVAFARERGDDRPTDTAIDRLGPTSPTPREEWRDDRRDRRLEQEILNAIQAGMTATRPAGD